MRGRSPWGIVGLAIVVLVVAGVVWLAGFPSKNHPAPGPPVAQNVAPSHASPSSGVAASSTPIDPRRATTVPADARGLSVWPGAEEASRELNRPDQSAREDLDVVHTLLADYHSVFGQVPEGGLNEEITRGLLGENPKQLVFLVLKKGQLDASGALLDRWATPYFFHKLSHDVIDLRSAGPDRKLWTKDDVFEESSGGPPL